uniref:Aminotransferase family protein n=1 Tax=Solanum tuberosum TaxID=4113 RepID=M1CJQ3_SOLTU
MENNTTTTTKWNFKENEKLVTALGLTVRSVLNNLTSCIDPADTRFVISLGHGDPSAFPCFRTTPIAEDAIADAVRSAKFNGYSSNVGILPARRAVAENLSQDLPYKLSPDDIYLTSGCGQAIEVILNALARPNANNLLPTPGFPC